MDTNAWIFLSLAAFDVMLLVAFYFYLRACGPIDRNALVATGAGLAGFVFHVFMFCSGAILYIQLATLAGIYGLFWMKHRGRVPKVS